MQKMIQWEQVRSRLQTRGNIPGVLKGMVVLHLICSILRIGRYYFIMSVIYRVNLVCFRLLPLAAKSCHSL
jgi:hypothetical protein